jgi:hypothetical protein
VNQHWGAVFKAALISTLLGIGTEESANNDDALVRALQRGSQDTINQAGQKIVQRQLDVQPAVYPAGLSAARRSSRATCKLGQRTHELIGRGHPISSERMGKRSARRS